MPTKLTTIASEEGTYKITLTYTDSAGGAVTPNTVTWTLTDSDGTVINSREDVAIGTPGTTNDVVLSGNDLAIQSTETWQYCRRLFTAKITYDSDEGSGLPENDEAEFWIENFTNVS